MELPVPKNKAAYTKAINLLQTELQTDTEDGQVLSNDQLDHYQSKLDAIAEKYQNDEELGSSRYKLYELQALLHYFQHNDEATLRFINHAITAKGESYPKAERLIARLNQSDAVVDASKMTKAERRKKLIGIEGWLAWFVVGTILAGVMTIYNFFADGFLATSDIDTLNQYQSGLGDSAQLLSGFENVSLLLYLGLLITSIVLIVRHRKFAKTIVIMTLAFSVVYGIIDYSITSSLFSDPDLKRSMQPFLDKYASTIGRNLIGAIIWIPYFLISKRVKATLTK